MFNGEIIENRLSLYKLICSDCNTLLKDDKESFIKNYKILCHECNYNGESLDQTSQLYMNIKYLYEFCKVKQTCSKCEDIPKKICFKFSNYNLFCSPCFSKYLDGDNSYEYGDFQLERNSFKESVKKHVSQLRNIKSKDSEIGISTRFKKENLIEEFEKNKKLINDYYENMKSNYKKAFNEMKNIYKDEKDSYSKYIDDNSDIFQNIMKEINNKLPTLYIHIANINGFANVSGIHSNLNNYKLFKEQIGILLNNNKNNINIQNKRFIIDKDLIRNSISLEIIPNIINN